MSLLGSLAYARRSFGKVAVAVSEGDIGTPEQMSSVTSPSTGSAGASL